MFNSIHSQIYNPYSFEVKLSSGNVVIKNDEEINHQLASFNGGILLNRSFKHFTLGMGFNLFNYNGNSFYNEIYIFREIQGFDLPIQVSTILDFKNKRITAQNVLGIKLSAGVFGNFITSDRINTKIEIVDNRVNPFNIGFFGQIALNLNLSENSYFNIGTEVKNDITKIRSENFQDYKFTDYSSYFIKFGFCF